MPVRPIACTRSRIAPGTDAAGRDAAEPGLLDDGNQRLLAGLARLQEGREVRPLAQLRDAQLERADAGVEGAGAMAVAVVEPLGRPFVPAGADHALDVGLHQELQHRLGDRTQEVAVVGLLQQLHPCHALLGHRILRRFQVKRSNSTLAERSDDHLAGDPAARPRPTRRRSLRRAASLSEFPPTPWTLTGRAAAEPGGRRWTPGETALFTATASTCLWTGIGLATLWLIPLIGS
jgi:hypothetical protein